MYFVQTTNFYRWGPKGAPNVINMGIISQKNQHDLSSINSKTMVKLY